MEKSQLGSEEECDAYWNTAEKSLRKLNDGLQREFQNAHRLILDGTHCYRKRLFIDKDWCNITDEVPPTIHGSAKIPSTKWGFCSSSCKVEYMQVCIICRNFRKINFQKIFVTMSVFHHHCSLFFSGQRKLSSLRNGVTNYKKNVR